MAYDLNGQTIAQYPPLSQNASPLTGSTVVMQDSSQDGILSLTPAGTIAALIIVLPTEAKSIVNQERTISTTANITLLTVNGASTIYNVPSSMLAGDCFTLKKSSPNIWFKK